MMIIMEITITIKPQKKRKLSSNIISSPPILYYGLDPRDSLIFPPVIEKPSPPNEER
jgi:hypothetical protein